MFNAKEHEQMRRQLWMDTFISASRAPNSSHCSRSTEFADAALREFDKRFSATHTDRNMVKLKDD